MEIRAPGLGLAQIQLLQSPEVNQGKEALSIRLRLHAVQININTFTNFVKESYDVLKASVIWIIDSVMLSPRQQHNNVKTQASEI